MTQNLFEDWQHSWVCISILRDWYQAGWDLVSFSKSHNFLLHLQTFYFGEECLYLTTTSGPFLALREYLSSGQLTSSKKKFWPVDEYQRINTMHSFQSPWLTSSKAKYKKLTRNITVQLLLTASVTLIFRECLHETWNEILFHHEKIFVYIAFTAGKMKWNVILALIFWSAIFIG